LYVISRKSVCNLSRQDLDKSINSTTKNWIAIKDKKNMGRF